MRTALWMYGRTTAHDRDAWDSPPNHAWQSFLRCFCATRANTFGLRGVLDASALQGLAPFRGAELHAAGVTPYEPYAVTSGGDQAEYRERIALFALDAGGLERLLSIPFDAFRYDNPELPVEELVFARNGRVLVIAAPVDDIVVLQDLTGEDLAALAACPVEIRDHLWRPSRPPERFVLSGDSSTT